MAFSSFCPTHNFTRHFTVSSKPNLIYRHQTRTKNPAQQSVACAIRYFRMSIRMGKADSCKITKHLIVARVFGFHFVMYGVENKRAS